MNEHPSFGKIHPAPDYGRRSGGVSHDSTVRATVVSASRIRWAWSCGLLLLAAALAADDLLVLRSGESRTGALKACTEDRCTHGSSRIPRHEISWIGLSQEKGAIPSLSASILDQVVLRDGTTLAGSLAGISLGLVILGDTELARADVAWIRFADPTATTTTPPPGEAEPAQPDAVVLRDGTLRVGSIVACVGGSCLMRDSGRIARGSIAAIVFGGGAEALDSSAAGDEDRVTLRSGDVHEGAVLAIDPVQVIVASRIFPRDTVAAVVFADESSPSGPWGAPGDPPPPGHPPVPPPGPSPSPGPTGGSPPTPPSSSPGPAGPATPPASSISQWRRGGLWTGTCQGSLRSHDDSCTHVTRFIHRLVLREWEIAIVTTDPTTGAQVRSGRHIWLEPEGSTIENDYSLVCSGGSAAGKGTRTVSVTPDQNGFTNSSGIFFGEGYDFTSSLGVDIPIGGTLYYISLPIRTEDTYQVTHRFGSEVWVDSTAGYIGCLAGTIPLGGNMPDPQIRALDGGRMQGSFSAPLGGDTTYEASWSVCREGADCPPPPAAPGGAAGQDEPFDPCARSGQQAALRDTCNAELDALTDALEPHFATYNAFMKSAEDNRPAFEMALKFCELYDKVKEFLEALLSAGTGSAAEGARALKYVRDIIEKAQQGDLASLLYPEQLQALLDTYNKVQEIWFELTADELAKMQSDLGGCSGKVPLNTMMKAKQFLADLSAAREVWDSKVAPGINSLRTLGLACAGRDHLAWRACLADAACQGVPPNCGPEPSLEGAYD